MADLVILVGTANRWLKIRLRYLTTTLDTATTTSALSQWIICAGFLGQKGEQDDIFCYTKDDIFLPLFWANELGSGHPLC
jgi:hypothetical protein